MRKLIDLMEMNQAEAMNVFRHNGVDPYADDLKSQYRKLMMRHHPDRGGDVEEAKKYHRRMMF